MITNLKTRLRNAKNLISNKIERSRRRILEALLAPALSPLKNEIAILQDELHEHRRALDDLDTSGGSLEDAHCEINNLSEKVDDLENDMSSEIERQVEGMCEDFLDKDAVLDVIRYEADEIDLSGNLSNIDFREIVGFEDAVAEQVANLMQESGWEDKDAVNGLLEEQLKKIQTEIDSVDAATHKRIVEVANETEEVIAEKVDERLMEVETETSDVDDRVDELYETLEKVERTLDDKIDGVNTLREMEMDVRVAEILKEMEVFYVKNATIKSLVDQIHAATINIFKS